MPSLPKPIDPVLGFGTNFVSILEQLNGIDGGAEGVLRDAANVIV